MNKIVWIAVGLIVVLGLFGLMFARGPSAPRTTVPAPAEEAAVPVEVAAPGGAAQELGAQAAVEAFFKSLAAGDVSGAYAAQARAAQAEDSPEAFAKAAVKAGFTQYASGAWTVTSATSDTVVLEGAITLRDGKAVPLQVTVVQEKGAWKIRSIGAAQ